MRTIWSFLSAREVSFGRGAAAELGRRTAELGLRRVWLVSDERLEAAGTLAPLRHALAEAGVACQAFLEGQPEPSLELAESCFAAARDWRPDGIVGVGGGSNLDLAKAVAILLAHGGNLRDYVGDSRVPGPIAPLLCIPTTAGTGSEVTASAVLTDAAQHIKVGILSNEIRPRLAIVDPLLTVSCPPRVSADSGIDALSHAIEALTAVDNAHFDLPAGERTCYQGANPLSDLVAEKAISLVGQFLVRAVQQPHDLEAREGMALAATLGGLAFSNSGVALVHAMEYPVGGAVHVSHGAGNGLLLPHVMRFNLPARPERMARIAELLGAPTAGLSATAASEAAIDAVDRLRQAIGVPARLRDLGVREAQLPEFAAKAFAIRRILRVNPRQPTCEEIESIYRAAW